MKILICTDGSEQAERAVRLGTAIAAGCEAEATLFGISETPGHSKQILESLNRGHELLKSRKVAAELVTKSGNPIEEIARRTREMTYDLVVIGAVRKETRGRFWMSSKTYKIIKEIQPPVLSVAGKTVAIKRALVCTGGKRYIESALKLTGRIVGAMGASVTLLHVLPELPPIYAGFPRMDQTLGGLLSSQSELGINLRSSKEMLENAGVPVELVLRHGPVLQEILRQIRRGDYDLVVTGSALSHSLRTYVLGDITREIVNRAQCAVLVVRTLDGPVARKFGIRTLFRRLTPG